MSLLNMPKAAAPSPVPARSPSFDGGFGTTFSIARPCALAYKTSMFPSFSRGTPQTAGKRDSAAPGARRISMQPISRLLILHKDHPQPEETGRALLPWLRERHVDGVLLPAGADAITMRAQAAASDAVLVLGGDGTMVGVARRLAGIRTPIAGMNFGRVGFLAGLPAEDWAEPLSAMLQGRWELEKHLTLRWRVLRRCGDTLVPRNEGVAINDVVTAHGVVARAVSLSLHIDGVLFSTLRCDGIIVSTPLGSTAYTASAGGPLTMPSMNAQLVTPICPFAGGFPPLALPAASRIHVEACRQGDQVLLSVDGQENLPLEFGDVLEIRGVPGQLHMLVSDTNWYLRRLIDRGIVTSGPGRREKN